jgi:hypothetical protein
VAIHRLVWIDEMYNKRLKGRIKAKKVPRNAKLVSHESMPYDRTPKPHPSGVIIVPRAVTAAVHGPPKASDTADLKDAKAPLDELSS